jgi:hypothetical protein
LTPADWHLYRFDRTREGGTLTANFGDFDAIAVGDDAVVITWNAYTLASDSGVGARIRVLDKAKLVAGEPVTSWTDFAPTENGRPIFGRLLPATAFGAADGVYLVSLSTTSTCGFVVWRIANASAPRLESRVVSASSSCDTQPPEAPEPGGGVPLDTKNGTEFGAQPVYRDGSIWAAHTVAAGGVPPFSWTPERLVGVVRSGGKDRVSWEHQGIHRSRTRRSSSGRRSSCSERVAGRWPRSRVSSASPRSRCGSGAGKRRSTPASAKV